MLPGLDPVMGSPQVIDAHAVSSPKNRESGRIQLKGSALPAALGEQLHLVPCRESPGDATEGDTFALMAGAGFGQKQKTQTRPCFSTAPPEPLESKKKKKIKNPKINNKQFPPD